MIGNGVRVRILLVVLVGGAIAVYAVASAVSGIGNAVNGGRHYSDTLGEVQQKFGSGAKVVKIEADGGGVEYDVLSPDGSHVLIRNYSRTSEQTTDPNTGAPATGYNDHTDDSRRAATPADVKGASVTLGQLDKDIVERLWDQAGFPHRGSVATLVGSTWTITSGASPFDRYQANFDGSGFHQTQSKSDVFGGDSTTSVPPPTPAPSSVPPAAVKRARAIAACMRRAHGNVAKIQACVGQ
jgi:hypothetical protein